MPPAMKRASGRARRRSGRRSHTRRLARMVPAAMITQGQVFSLKKISRPGSEYGVSDGTINFNP